MKKQNKHLPFSESELKIIRKSQDKLSQLFLLTGVRRFELKQLFGNDIESGVIKIIGKGQKFRIVPVTDKVASLIKELKPEWSWKSDRAINLHFERMGKLIGITREKDNKVVSAMNPHRFRATFATKLINNGVDLVTIQTLMGHSKISTTAQYIKINGKYLREAISMLSNPKYDLDGMTTQELKKEVLRLRRRLNRLVDCNE